MRLHLLPGTSGHSELASGVSWAGNGDIYTASDDQSVQRWSERGEARGKVCALDTHVADLHCLPAASGKSRQQSSDVFALACTDGTLKLIAGNGRLEKSAEAHAGAVLCVRWSPDGSAIATAGEDGQVKVWSRAGMLRSTIMAADEPAYCVAWGGSSHASNQLLVCTGSCVSIKGLQGAGAGGGAAAPAPAGISRANIISSNNAGGSSSSQASWKAHDGLVLTADWHAATNLIVTGGEDCRFKVWDAYGRLLYQSSCWEHAITSVAWSPDGQLFAVGSFNSLALCDRQGWSHCQVQPPSGSLLGLSWSQDGTQLAGAGSSGAVLVAAVLEAVVEDGRVSACLAEERVVRATDMAAETHERLEFRDRVVMMSAGFGHLLVCTRSHCHIYATSNWNTPHIFDLGDQPQLLLQCSRNFVLVGAAAGLQVTTYEARQVCVIKPPGLRPDSISRQLVSLSPDTLVLAAGSSVRCFDTAQGRPVGEALSHSVQVKAVALSQVGTAADRLLALLDSNGDLFVTRPLVSSSTTTPAAAAAGAGPGGSGSSQVTAAGLITAGGLVAQGSSQQQLQQRRLVKLAGSVSSPPVWHETAPMLAAVVGGQLRVWCHPAAAFLDAELLQATRVAINTADSSALGSGASLDLFSGSSLMLARPDGARVFGSIPPQPVLLHELVRQGRWDRAVRLARFSNDGTVWACLAALAMAAGELPTAEVAFAAIDAADKLQYVLHLRGLVSAGAPVGSDPVVAAELLLCAGQAQEAEAKLLQAGLVYRAIKLRTRLHHWQRALALARQHKEHIDTVLMLRGRYLAAVGQAGAETLPEFVAAAKEVAVDEAAVVEAVGAAKAAEAVARRRGGGKALP